MRNKFYFDFETRSQIDITEVGLDNYARHSSTEVLMMAYSLDGGAVKVWEPRLEPMPQEARNALLDSETVKLAWNVPFEFNILTHVLKVDVPLSRFFDPMCYARYLSLPGSLGDCGQVLNIAGGKDRDGKRLVRMFSAPTKATKAQIKAGKPESYYRDWISDPEDWAKFVEYCRRDVDAMRTAYLHMLTLDEFPALEYKAWMLDQIVNHRGVPIDSLFVENAARLAFEATERLKLDMKIATGLTNPNSPAQLKAWLHERGYKSKSVDKANVAAALADSNTHPEIRAVLEIKQKLGGTSYSKLRVIKQRVSADGRLRHQFTYHGAHTGRWSSHGVQLHNLSRGSKAVTKRMDEVVEAIRAGFVPSDLGVIDAITSTLRASFRAADGELLMCDLSSIENRVLAWVSGCRAMTEVFEKGLDPYLAFAVKLFGKPYDTITPEERQQAKPAVLGCGFGMSGERLQESAAEYGVTFTEEQCAGIVTAFREAYPEVPRLWSDLERHAMAAVKDQTIYSFGYFRFDGSDARVLKIGLPSGRNLHYHRPLVAVTDGWYGQRQSLTFESNTSKGWQMSHTYGAKLCENLVQSVARDVLLNAMFAAHRRGLTLIAHVHDELVCEAPSNSTHTVADLRDCMIRLPVWATVTLPLDAKGHNLPYYAKD